MLELQVNGMICGHCEKAVTRAVQSADPNAKVTVERAAGRVSVDSGSDPQTLKQAIEGKVIPSRAFEHRLLRLGAAPLVWN